jgi:hypothetical protein
MCQYQRAHGAVIFGEHPHHFFGFRAVGKCRKAAHIQERDDDFTAMSFQEVFAAALTIDSASCGEKKFLSRPSRRCGPPVPAPVCSRFFVHSASSAACDLHGVPQFFDAQQRAHAGAAAQVG